MKYFPRWLHSWKIELNVKLTSVQKSENFCSGSGGVEAENEPKGLKDMIIEFVSQKCLNFHL